MNAFPVHCPVCDRSISHLSLAAHNKDHHKIHRQLRFGRRCSNDIGKLPIAASFDDLVIRQVDGESEVGDVHGYLCRLSAVIASETAFRGQYQGSRLPNRQAFLAERDDRIIGFLWLKVGGTTALMPWDHPNLRQFALEYAGHRVPIAWEPERLVVETFWVAQEHRQQGIARALARVALDTVAPGSDLADLAWATPLPPRTLDLLRPGLPDGIRLAGGDQ